MLSSTRHRLFSFWARTGTITVPITVRRTQQTISCFGWLRGKLDVGKVKYRKCREEERIHDNNVKWKHLPWTSCESWTVKVRQKFRVVRRAVLAHYEDRRLLVSASKILWFAILSGGMVKFRWYLWSCVHNETTLLWWWSANWVLGASDYNGPRQPRRMHLLRHRLRADGWV